MLLCAGCLLCSSESQACVSAAVVSMSSLHRLSLEGNRLTTLPKELGNLSHLRVLNANGNLLTAIPGTPCSECCN